MSDYQPETWYRAYNGSRRREVIVLVLLLVAIVGAGLFLYRTVWRTGTSWGSRVHREVYFICADDGEVQTFPLPAWLKKRGEILKSKDRDRKLGPQGEIICPKCGKLRAYPARKCPVDGTIFRSMLTEEEVEVGETSPNVLKCPKCGWSASRQYVTEKKLTPPPGQTPATRPRPTTRPVVTVPPVPTIEGLTPPPLTPKKTRPPPTKW